MSTSSPWGWGEFWGGGHHQGAGASDAGLPPATYLIILGFVVASIPTIFPGVPAGAEWIVCALTLLAGFGVVYKVSSL